MDGLIVYGSKYGTTRRYAEELSRLTGLSSIPCGEFHRLAEGSILIYLGALYAGGVLGLKQTMKGLSFREGQRLIVATVGLADPAEPQNRAHIRAALQKQLPPELSERAVLFHLRGGIDYAVLSPRHRAMMAAMCYGALKELPFEETCRLAMAVSAAAVTCAGTEAPAREQVDELLKQVELEVLDVL